MSAVLVLVNYDTMTRLRLLIVNQNAQYNHSGGRSCEPHVLWRPTEMKLLEFLTTVQPLVDMFTTMKMTQYK